MFSDRWEVVDEKRHVTTRLVRPCLSLLQPPCLAKRAWYHESRWSWPSHLGRKCPHEKHGASQVFHKQRTRRKNPKTARASITTQSVPRPPCCTEMIHHGWQSQEHQVVQPRGQIRDENKDHRTKLGGRSRSTSTQPDHPPYPPESKEYEPDQRHADILAMNLSGTMGVNVPGEDENNWMSENEQAVDPKEETHFRALAAQAISLALDRMNLQSAMKEVCGSMAAPTKGHVNKLKRLIQHLIEAPKVETENKFQGDVTGMEVFSNSNWANCRRTARSTSGGAMMRGTHHLKSWSNTQKNVTLSNAEAELLAAIKNSGEALGMLQLMSSIGVPMTASIMAVVAKKGNQSGTSLGATNRRRGPRAPQSEQKENPSDACTKHLTGEWLKKLCRARGTVPKVGEHARVAPHTTCADCAGRIALYA